MNRILAATSLALALGACHLKKTSADAGDDDTTTTKCSSTVDAAPSRCALNAVAQLPAPVTAATVLRMGSDVVLVGGQGPGGSLSNGIAIATPSGGALTNWRAAAFPEARPNAGIVASGDRLYLFGGEIPQTVEGSTDVIFARRTTEGSFGEFKVTKPLAAKRTQMGAAATDTHAYLVGGRASLGASDDNTVTVVSFDGEGDVTDYAATTPLPGPRGRPSVFVLNDRLYVVGGLFPGNDKSCPRDTVLFAPINADGTLGSWTPTSTPPKLPAGASVAATDKHVYLVGGVTTFGDTFQQQPVSSVLVADVAEDGTLSEWKRVASFKDTRYGHAAIVADGRLFAIGGLLESVQVLDQILVADVKSDGTVSCP